MSITKYNSSLIVVPFAIEYTPSDLDRSVDELLQAEFSSCRARSGNLKICALSALAPLVVIPGRLMFAIWNIAMGILMGCMWTVNCNSEARSRLQNYTWSAIIDAFSEIYALTVFIAVMPFMITLSLLGAAIHPVIAAPAWAALSVSSQLIEALRADLESNPTSGETSLGESRQSGLPEGTLVQEHLGPQLPAIEAPVSHFQNDLQYLGNAFANGTYSDVSLIVGDDRFQVHKIILSMRSEVFRNMFQSGMQEAASDEIAIGEADPEDFRLFLEYIYKDTLDPANMSIEKIGNLIDLGERYQVNGIKSHAAPVLAQHIKPDLSMDELAGIWNLAYLYGLETVSTRCERELINRINLDTLEAIAEFAEAHQLEAIKQECNRFRQHCQSFRNRL